MSISHSEPYSVFVAPVKASIKAALVSAGISELDISYSAVERNASSGARILSSKLPPTMDRVKEAKPAQRVNQGWTGDDGSVWQRWKMCDLIVVYQVDMWAERLSLATGYLFDFIRHLPRACFDAMPKGGVAIQPNDEKGNRIELFPFAPQLPDDTTETAKQYKSSVLIRADGGIYLDSSPLQEVSVSTRLSANFAS